MDSLEKIKSLRKERGYTLKELAEKSGVPAGTVNKLFSGGIKSIKAETLIKLANALGADYSEILNGCERAAAEADEKNEIKQKCAFDYGFARIAAYAPEVRVADVDFNVQKIIEKIMQANGEGVCVAAFPELAVTAYTVGDLVYQPALLDAAKNGLLRIMKATENLEMLVVVGLPVKVDGRIYNCAAAVNKGELLGIVPKINLPNYNEFYEKRTFCEGSRDVKNIEFLGRTVPFGGNLIFADKAMPELQVGVEICEDIWVPDSPSINLALAGATVIINASASNDVCGKADYRRSLVSVTASKLLCAYVYCSCGAGESTGDVVFGGHCIINEAGRQLSECAPFGKYETSADVDCSFLEFERGKKFHGRNEISPVTFVYFEAQRKNTGLIRKFAQSPFVPDDKEREKRRVNEVFAIQTEALKKRVLHVNAQKLVVGVSGGLDSALALLVAGETLKKAGRKPSDLVAITMPCFGTGERTRKNALALSEGLKCELKEIDIKNSVLQHFADIEKDPSVTDAAYENAQARERTQVLMDYANMVNGLVVGTGDMSELALGWCTYNGDHMSMYGVNGGVPKTLVKSMVLNLAKNYDEKTRRTLEDIAATPISPELTPSKGGATAQFTEDILGPYELHDFFLYYLIKHGYAPDKVYYIAKQTFAGKYDKEIIQKCLYKFINRFFASQFKRSCQPDGVKTGALCLSPRGDFRMPSDGVKNVWIKLLDQAIAAEKN